MLMSVRGFFMVGGGPCEEAEVLAFLGEDKGDISKWEMSEEDGMEDIDEEVEEISTSALSWKSTLYEEGALDRKVGSSWSGCEIEREREVASDSTEIEAEANEDDSRERPPVSFSSETSNAKLHEGWGMT